MAAAVPNYSSTPVNSSLPVHGSHQSSKANETPKLSETEQKKLPSLPSRQRKKGPAPLASFEDLSMDKNTSDSSSTEEKSLLPGIGEESSEVLSPHSPSIRTAELTVPASPRIRVSAASSSSAHDTDSKESTPDKELFIGYTKKDYCEEMSDVKTSTEELLSVEQKQRRAKELLKRKESGKQEDALKVADLNRKESSSSILSDNFLPVTSAHSSRFSSLGSTSSNARRSPSPHRMKLETSFCGSKPIQQPSIDLEDPQIDTTNLLNYTIESLEHLKSPIESRRDLSQSPPSIPKQWNNAQPKTQFQEKRDKIDHELSKINQNKSPKKHQTTGENEYQSNISEKFSKESKTALGKKVLPREPPSNVTKSGVCPSPPPPPPVSPGHQSKNKTPLSSPKVGKKLAGKKSNTNGVESTGSTPSNSRKSSFSSIFRRGEAVLSPVTPDSPGRKSPFKELIKSAKNEMRSRSRSRSKSRDRDLEDEKKGGVLSIFKPKEKKKLCAVPGVEGSHTNHEVESRTSEAITNVEFTFNKEEVPSLSSEIISALKDKEDLRKNSEPVETNTEDKIQKEEEITLSEKESPPNDNMEADHGVSSTSYKSVIESLEMKQKDMNEKKLASPPPIPPEETKNEELKQLPKEEVAEPSTSDLTKEESVRPKKEELNVQRPSDDSRSESERESEIEYFRKKQALGIEEELRGTTSTEIRKLVTQDFAEDDELPYVPTTLPIERSQVAPMIPVRDRPPSLKMVTSIERPRSATPLQPGRLDKYRESIDALESDSDTERITITIPNSASMSKSANKQTSKSWEDFCEEGLRSVRKSRKDESKSDDDSLQGEELSFEYHPEDSPQRTKDWINFDELPDINMKPVTHIKTITQKQTSTNESIRKPKLIQQKRIDSSRLNDESDFTFKEKKKVQCHHSSPLPIRSTASTPERDDSSERSSDSERLGSQSSSEELTTIREKIAEIKKREDKGTFDGDNSDLERLLAPVNECINKLSSLSVQNNERIERKSPIPDNWADFLLPPQPGKRSRLSSLGSEAGSVGGRSTSPSPMLLETSFCGSQPIHDPGFAEPNVPMAVARKMSGISLGDLSPLMARAAYGGTTSLHQFDGASVVSDSSAEGFISPKDKAKEFDPHHHRSSSEYSTRSAPPAPPRRNLHPFGMDLEIKSNRSSVVSQDKTSPESPS